MKPGRVAAAVISAVLLMGAGDDPGERLADPAKEARARRLFQQLRCVVCQNESIDDSEADLAQDLRRIVRGQVAEGRSDAEIRRFLVDRYGEFILLTPSANPANLALWLVPPGLLLVAGVALFLQARKQKALHGSFMDDEDEIGAFGGDDVAADTNSPRKRPTNTLGDDGNVT